VFWHELAGTPPGRPVRPWWTGRPSSSSTRSRGQVPRSPGGSRRCSRS